VARFLRVYWKRDIKNEDRPDCVLGISVIGEIANDRPGYIHENKFVTRYDGIFFLCKELEGFFRCGKGSNFWRFGHRASAAPACGAKSRLGRAVGAFSVRLNRPAKPDVVRWCSFGDLRRGQRPTEGGLPTSSRGFPETLAES
jgi:hypothetical protein